MTTPEDHSPAEGQPTGSGWGHPTDPGWGRPSGQAQQGAQPGAQQGWGQPVYGQPAYGYPAMLVPAPTHPSATTALVLGIVSLVGAVTCGLPLFAAPVAWVIGGRAVREIDENPQRWSGRESANAGRIMGMVGTALLILILLGLIVFAIGLVVAESS